MQLVTFLRPYWLLCPLSATNSIPSTAHIPNTNRSVWNGVLLVVLNFVRKDYMRWYSCGDSVPTTRVNDMAISVWPFFPATNSCTLERPVKQPCLLMVSKLNRNSELCLYTLPNFNIYNLLLFCYFCSFF